MNERDGRTQQESKQSPDEIEDTLNGRKSDGEDGAEGGEDGVEDALDEAENGVDEGREGGGDARHFCEVA